MRISGLQKLTLLDYPGKVACTVFLGGCDFRCPFCHNIGLVTDPMAYPEISTPELLAFLKKRQGVLDGVCVTGGEPLLSDDVFALLKQIKALGYAIKLDTNGSFPQRLRSAVEMGLVDTVAMDIKNSPEKYAMTAGALELDMAPIQESVRYLLSGAVDYEFRTTVVAEYHTLEDFKAIGKWIAGAKRYFLQPFVDSDGVAVGGLHAPTKTELEATCKILAKTVKTVEMRGL